MRASNWKRKFVSLFCLLFLPVTAEAVIRPDFTPANLFEKSTAVAEIKISADGKSELKPPIHCEVIGFVKGKFADAKLFVDANDIELAAVCAAMLTDEPTPAILFVGSEKNAALHWGGRWFPLEASTENRWRILSEDRNLTGIWNGNTARLLRAVRQVASDPRTTFPVRSMCRWKEAGKIGETKAAVTDTRILHSFVDDVVCLRLETADGVRALRLDERKLVPLSEKAVKEVSAQTDSEASFDFDGDKKPDDLKLVDGKFTLQGWGDLSTDKSDGTSSSLALGDFNQDGLPDIVVVEPKTSPRFYFNRGFGSFVRAYDLSRLNDEPLSPKGTQSIAIGDLNSNGLTDVVVIDGNGEIWLFEIEPEAGSSLGLHVVLGETFKNKTAVAAFEGERFLGQQWGRAGSILFFAKPNRGPLTLRYIGTDGEEKSQQTLVIKRGARITLAN